MTGWPPTGPDLFSRLVIATGDVASQPVREFLNRTPRPVLEKPFELSSLAELVGKVRGVAYHNSVNGER